MVALIIGMVGCGSGQYSLTIYYTEGGWAWAPSGETSNLDYGTVVHLEARARGTTCYEFVNWTGDVGTIADAENDYTTITMNGSYIITANFAPKVSENMEIWDWYDLDAVRDNLCWNYTLMNDLNSTTPGYEELAGPMANGGTGWRPIGYSGSELYHPFKGIFNGQGYEIHDLFIHSNYFFELGLFGLSYGLIEYIGVVNATVVGVGGFVGALVGKNEGAVSNSYSTASVSGNENYGAVGGLIGENSGTVSDSYSTSNVTGERHIGGLVGLNYEGIVSNSHYNYDEVLINGENIITRGALFGEDFDEWLANDKFLDVNERLSQESGYYVVNNVADFKELLAFGQDSSLKFRLKNDLDLAAEPNLYIPYLAGEFDGNGHKISNLSFDFDFISRIGLFGCLAPDGKLSQVGVENVNITGAGFVGGLVGDNDGGTVSNSYSTGNVTGESHIGGLVGENDGGTVSNSYSTGSVTGERLIGGLVGDNGKYRHESTVSNSYSTSSVSGNENVGGLVGKNDYGGTVGDSYSTGSVSGNEGVGGLV